MKSIPQILRSDSQIWRYLANFWTLLLYGAVVYDFWTKNTLRESLVILSTVYIGILAIYVSDKEFERWYDKHKERHPGEWFVVLWTLLVAGILVATMIFHYPYQLPTEVISAYIAVLTLLAITNQSKSSYGKRRKPY